ncbi:DUF1415 domain-containing protein [Marinobacterium arenosum]|uniref:DUF1415 domain-containing protein n=1 Tax=Marinobacterium arenosum TaxID=2862496 RepID=UPI001C949B55|nr:DUF1415 domain-containing protein [Marinobacterium arenosum]MBY4676534.1 DUF1415 domain-containing protein [Marinobacterium arenosum]
MNKKVQQATPETVIKQTREWVEAVVVGLNLCPFAAPVVRQQTIRYAVSEAVDEEVLLQDFLRELHLLQQSDEEQIATTVLSFSRALQCFDDYLDLLAVMEGLVEQAGLDGVFQLASFHPDYLFDGVDAEDRSHWTNRSPWPAVHIIREGQMSRVLMHYKDPEQIPERNIELLRSLPEERLRELFPHLF